MWTELKQEIITFFYGFTRIYANRLRKARARVRAVEKERDIYFSRSKLYAAEVLKLAGMLEAERRTSNTAYQSSLHAAERIAAQKKDAAWARVVLLGNEAVYAEQVALAKRPGERQRIARAKRGSATRAMNKWKEAKKEFDKKYPPCE